MANLYVHNAADFCKTYTTTTEYRNLRIGFDSDVASGRRYVVNFDVLDQYPASELYSLRFSQMKYAVEKKLINEAVLVDFLTWDLSRSYQIPPNLDLRRAVTSYVADRKLDYLFSPEVVSEFARQAGFNRLPQAPVEAVWAHFTQRVTLEKENGEWKIRTGLYPPILRANYPPGAAIP